MFFDRDTYASVFYGEVKAGGVVLRRLFPHPQEDFASLGEFYGITDQVDEDLADATRVADVRLGDVVLNVANQLETFLVRANAD